MPFCEVRDHDHDSSSPASTVTDAGVKIFYKKFGRGNTKLLLIIGLAGTHGGWAPQVKGLAGVEDANEEGIEAVDREFEGLSGEGRVGKDVEICCFDNRGMGRSFVPMKKSEYTTTKMAKDALALLDHLGWKKAHIVGHSMGGMIACKLAAMAPDRLCSLALLNVTGGGYQCFPRIDRQLVSLAIRFLRAKTPEQRAMVDLETHYSKEYLEELVGSSTRRDILYQEYVKGISSSGMQSKCGFEGQINACWTHSMSTKELDTIRSAGFLVLILHGRYDVIAQVRHARKLADQLHPAARMLELHGAHLVSHERTKEVNNALSKLITASESGQSVDDWSNLLQDDFGGLSVSLSVESNVREVPEANYFRSTYDIMAKFQLFILYIFGLFIFALGHVKKAYRLLQPSRVGASPS